MAPRRTTLGINITLRACSNSKTSLVCSNSGIELDSSKGGGADDAGGAREDVVVGDGVIGTGGIAEGVGLEGDDIENWVWGGGVVGHALQGVLEVELTASRASWDLEAEEGEVAVWGMC